MRYIISHRSLLICIFLFVIIFQLDAQNGTWTWMSGSPTPNLVGSFGSQGVPAASNQPPGLYESAEWTDLNGNFWIFGGTDNSNLFYSALWKFDVTTGLWIWMKGSSTTNSSAIYGTQGIPSPANNPGAHGFGATSWTDLTGNLWLFGGQGFNGTGNYGYMNELWKYDIITNEWTWISGSTTPNSLGNFGVKLLAAPTNLPRARSECAASWVDNSGNLWMFSGSYSISQIIDDMWMYNIATNQWTWMCGQSVGNSPVNYGTLLVPALSNTPGGRVAYNHWKDKQGNFWLFGGYESGPASLNIFADMWMYNPVTNLWTWMAGSSIANATTTFTQQCIPGNGLPGSVTENRACWTDNCGRFWMFGGGNAINISNIMWVFDPTTLLFTWAHGSLTSNLPGNFGMQNISSTLNTPPSLQGSMAFYALNGDLWLFGGTDLFNNYNTLWRYQINPNCPLSTGTADFVSLPDSIGCTPFLTQFVPLSTTASNYHWDFGEAVIDSDTSNQDTTSWTFNLAGTYTVTLIIDGGCGIDTSSRTIEVSDPPAINLGADTVICAGQSLLLNSIIPGSYVWNTGAITASYLVSTSGLYSVQVTDTFNCVVVDTIAITVTPLPTPDLGNDTAICTGQTVQLNPGLFDNYLWNTGATTSTITANAQGNYSVQVELNKCFNSDTIAITVDELPLIGVGTDSVRCKIVLDAGNPGASYLWNTGETAQIITATQSGTYSVAITKGTCIVVDSITINGEVGGGLLYIPNAFTPDQNGLNEKFQPIGTNIDQFSMVIYNRWGNKIFETNNFSQGWDGRINGSLVQEDVYVYVINYTSDCLNGKQLKKQGHVMVIR